MITLTVVTVTYNRAHTLHRVFDSLMEQSYKDFEWLVVDDGSTDGTEELIREYAKRAWFPVRYHKNPHGGKYAGANKSYELIQTKYMTACDSDDAMLPDGLRILMKLWDEVPKVDYDNTWCVTARCADSETGEMVGDPFPDDINQLHGKKRLKVVYATSGEKQSCRKVEILRKYPFPTYEDTTKLVPGSAWIRIDDKYEQYCSNALTSRYWQTSPDSMAKSPSKERKTAYYRNSLMLINEFPHWFWFNQGARLAYINVSRCGWRGGKSTGEIIKNVNGAGRKTLVLLCMPISAFYNLFLDKHRKGIH